MLLKYSSSASPEHLKNILQKCYLTSREIIVLMLRFGFDDGEYKTLQQVADRCGITKQRACELESIALRKIRHSKYTKELADYMQNPSKCLDSLDKYAEVDSNDAVFISSQKRRKLAEQKRIIEIRRKQENNNSVSKSIDADESDSEKQLKMYFNNTMKF